MYAQCRCAFACPHSGNQNSLVFLTPAGLRRTLLWRVLSWCYYDVWSDLPSTPLCRDLLQKLSQGAPCSSSDKICVCRHGLLCAVLKYVTPIIICSLAPEFLLNPPSGKWREFWVFPISDSSRLRTGRLKVWEARECNASCLWPCATIFLWERREVRVIVYF
jgi:hypothetical protein